jgi:hypothetical protein
MISKATPSGTWSADAAARLAAGIAREDDVATRSATTDAPQSVELASVGAWAELLREIAAVANGGGGHLDVRCVANGDSGGRTGRVFSVPIESVPATKPTDSKPGTKGTAPPNLQPVRIVIDPEAPALQPQDVDHLYPWRQKDLLRELNSRLGRRALNSYDIQAVRRQHQLDDRPDFVFNLPGAGRRYSPAVAEWIMDQYTRTPEFFHEARAADHEIMKLRRQKPK